MWGLGTQYNTIIHYSIGYTTLKSLLTTSFSYCRTPIALHYDNNNKKPALHYTTPHFTTLNNTHYTSLACTSQPCTVYFNFLKYSAQHFTTYKTYTLYQTAQLHNTTLHWTLNLLTLELASSSHLSGHCSRHNIYQTF